MIMQDTFNIVISFHNWQIFVIVSKEFLEMVEKNVLCQRRSWRVDAANVNTLCNYALLMSDHSVFPKGSFYISTVIK